MILSKCAICGSKKLRFFKNQEAKELLSKYQSEVIFCVESIKWIK